MDVPGSLRCLHSVVVVDRPRSFAIAFVAYSALRIALFAVPLVVIYQVSGNPILSAVLAAAIGLALSVVLLGRQRTSLVSVLRERTEARKRPSDEAAEDGAVEASGPVDTTGAAGTTGQADSAAAKPRP